MKTTSATAALITPDVDGWRVAGVKYASLKEAVAAVPAKDKVHLALPCHDVLIERMKLPSTDHGELSGMLQLQLEKTLPYPVEEVSTAFEVLNAADNESTLLSVAAHTGQLGDLCEPLREEARLPQRITLFAMHVAATCPVDEVVLVIYPEQGKLVTAIVENGKLGWAQTSLTADMESIASELPQILLGAELDGAPMNFSSIRLARGLESLEPGLEEEFHVPIHIISLDAPMPEATGNLLPPAWEADTKRLERNENRKQQLMIAALAWLVAIACAFVYLAWLKHRVQAVGRDLAAARPELDFINSRESRWNALAPAVDPSRYTVEVLFEISKSRPSNDVKITEFDQQLGQWKVVGEAPNAAQAIEFVDKLKKNPELTAWQVSAGPPQLLPNEHAQFSIFGKR